MSSGFYRIRIVVNNGLRVCVCVYFFYSPLVLVKSRNEYDICIKDGDGETFLFMFFSPSLFLLLCVLFLFLRTRDSGPLDYRSKKSEIIGTHFLNLTVLGQMENVHGKLYIYLDRNKNNSVLIETQHTVDVSYNYKLYVHIYKPSSQLR